MRPVVRRATADDIRTFYPDMKAPTAKMWVADMDGELLGIGGLVLWQGRWYAVADFTERMRDFPFTIARAGRMVVKDAKEMGIRYVYADADKDIPRAVPWLFSLGFQPDPRSGWLYRWENEECQAQKH